MTKTRTMPKYSREAKLKLTIVSYFYDNSLEMLSIFILGDIGGLTMNL